MRAYLGDDTAWKPMRGFFTPARHSIPKKAGIILTGPRNFDAAKRLLAEGGYAGQPAPASSRAGHAHPQGLGDVAADLLTRLGMNVDFRGDGLGHRYRAPDTEPGSWHMYPPGISRRRLCQPPATNKAVRANGDEASSAGRAAERSRPRSPPGSMRRRSTEEKWPCAGLNKAALDHVVYVPLGLFMMNQAWRRNVTGIVKAVPFFWGSARAFDALTMRPAMKDFLVIPEVLAQPSRELKRMNGRKRASALPRRFSSLCLWSLGRGPVVIRYKSLARKSLHVCTPRKLTQGESLGGLSRRVTAVIAVSPATVPVMMVCAVLPFDRLGRACV